MKGGDEIGDRGGFLFSRFSSMGSGDRLVICLLFTATFCCNENHYFPPFSPPSECEDLHPRLMIPTYSDYCPTLGPQQTFPSLLNCTEYNTAVPAALTATPIIQTIPRLP